MRSPKPLTTIPSLSQIGISHIIINRTAKLDAKSHKKFDKFHFRRSILKIA